MTLDKAIELLRRDLDDPGSLDNRELKKARNLGIEALKHHKKLRDAHPYSNYKILPGETTD